MRLIALVLVCFSCASKGHRVQTAVAPNHGTRLRNPLKVLKDLVLASNPVSAWQAVGAARPQIRGIRGRNVPTPRMQETATPERTEETEEEPYTGYPMYPEKHFTAEQTIDMVCKGLLLNDYPFKDCGVQRLFHFMKPEGRVPMAPMPMDASGYQFGAGTPELFAERAAAQVLGKLCFANGYRRVGPMDLLPPTKQRGAWALQNIEIWNNPLIESTWDASETYEYMKLFREAGDEYLEKLLEAARAGAPTPPFPVMLNHKEQFRVKMEKDKFTGSWNIVEFLPCRKSALQQWTEGYSGMEEG